jgi:archaellum component FlaG (FlaF/FlaG flagellin family)
VKTKIFALLILAIVLLTTTGYSYACYNGRIQIDCYCSCSLAFTKVTTSDNENEKDIGKIYATLSCNKNIIIAQITNTYPCYEATITYTIKNTGNRPIQFTTLTIINPNPEALEITTTNHTGTALYPCQTLEGTTKVHVLQPAKENGQYLFQIKIGATCQPKDYPHTIGFWKNQFTANLGKLGKPQIPAEDLENYLNQITRQSQIFKFTGTRQQKFQQALHILNPIGSSMEAKLKAQLLALWLNHVAGWTEGYTLNGMTAQQIIQGSENALLKHQTNKYEYWKNLCDKFNNLGE